MERDKYSQPHIKLVGKIIKFAWIPGIVALFMLSFTFMSRETKRENNIESTYQPIYQHNFQGKLYYRNKQKLSRASKIDAVFYPIFMGYFLHQLFYTKIFYTNFLFLQILKFRKQFFGKKMV